MVALRDLNARGGQTLGRSMARAPACVLTTARHTPVMGGEPEGLLELEMPAVTEDPALELVRRAFAALNRRDDLALLATCHRDIEWRPMRREGMLYRGHAGVREALSDVEEEFEHLHNDPREVSMVGDAVVVVGRLVAKERSSGVRIDRSAAWVCVIRDRLVGEMIAFPDGASAHAAAHRRLGLAR